MAETAACTRLAAPAASIPHLAFDALAARERVSGRYWSWRDPINELRTRWRAQTVRHLFHVLPGECFLELGCGSGQPCAAWRASSLSTPSGRPAPHAGHGMVELLAVAEWLGLSENPWSAGQAHPLRLQSAAEENRASGTGSVECPL
jgi:hypothetical protein